MTTTTTNIGELDRRLAEARAELEAAEAAELAAFEAVAAARETHAMGEISRRELLARQRALASAQEAAESKKALLRAMDRRRVQAAEAAAAAEARARGERDRVQREAAAAFEAITGSRLASIVETLARLADEARDHPRGLNTDRNRADGFAAAVKAVDGIRRLYQ